MKNFNLCFIPVIFFFFCCCTLLAQPTIIWQKCFGGSGWDAFLSIKQTIDNGYILYGVSESNDGDVTGNHNSRDIWVVKISDTGQIQWEHSLGGSQMEQITGEVQQTLDGGYIVAGASNSNDGDVTGHHGTSTYSDFWVIKLSDSGSIQWQRSYGGSLDDYCTSVEQTKDSGYILTGWTSSNDGDVTAGPGYPDFWIVKLDDTGSIQWQKTIGGLSEDHGNCIRQTSDGGYIVTGYIWAGGGNVTSVQGWVDFWVVKLSDTGSIQWQNTLGGSDGDVPYTVDETFDGGYIVCGWAYSDDGHVTGNHGDEDYWIVKLDSSGVLQWQKAFGGTEIDRGGGGLQTSDKGYLVFGASCSNNGDVTGHHGGISSGDCWIVKTDSAGALIWQASYGGTNNDGGVIMPTVGGGYIIGGYSFSNDGDVSGNHGSSDYWVVKLSDNIVNVDRMNLNRKDFSIYPNPAKDKIYIEMQQNLISAEFIIKNVLGQTVITGEIMEKNSVVDISSLTRGIYLLSSGNNLKQTIKLIKQ
jgi:hypothetical protein